MNAIDVYKAAQIGHITTGYSTAVPNGKFLSHERTNMPGYECCGEVFDSCEDCREHAQEEIHDRDTLAIMCRWIVGAAVIFGLGVSLMIYIYW